MSEFSRLLKRQTIIAALCYLALGLLFVCVPEITERAIALLVAVALLLFGIFKVIVYLARRSANEPDSSSLPTGTILALSGLVFLIKPEFLVSIVYAILGISLIVNGALKLQVCVELRREESPYWGSVALACAASIILGAIAVFAPFATAKTVIILVGISMICCAVFDAVSAIFFIKTND